MWPVHVTQQWIKMQDQNSGPRAHMLSLQQQPKLLMDKHLYLH